MIDPTPRDWNYEGLYSGFDDPRLLADLQEAETLAQSLKAHLSSRPSDPEPWLGQLFPLLDRSSDLLEHLGSYAYMAFSVATDDPRAAQLLGRVEEASLPFKDAQVRFRQVVKDLTGGQERWLEAYPNVRDYRLEWEEALVEASHQMSPELEDLYNDLSRAGGDAWSRLQGAVSSQLGVIWGPGEEKTVTELRSLAYHPDRDVRKKAYTLELQAWKSMEVPLAAALNGVKGFAVTGLQRRGWTSGVERAAFQNRLSTPALEALISALERHLPLFRSYLRDKARLLGLPACAFYDLFAPVGDGGARWTWERTQSFILENFREFSPRMGAFGERNFEKGWIHAAPRKGKVGGAYCTSLPLAGETRILLNFDGTFGEVRTLAHELGHGWHFEVMKDLPALQRSYPMTLAETASIFSETLIFEKAFASASGDQALFLLEQRLADVTQVLVDILSRYYFEKNVMTLRPQRELAPQEFSDLMVEAQKTTYGEGLDSSQLHPWMWAVKGHYYSPDQGFYNFPYAFGQLFSLGLYKLYQENPSTFPGQYETLLRQTGTLTCNQLALELGHDLEKPDFWNKSLETLAVQVRKFHQLTEEKLT